MGAVHLHADCNAVILAEQVGDGHLQVRNRAAQHADRVLQVVAHVRLVRGERVTVDGVRRQASVYYVEFAAAESAFEDVSG